MTSTPPAGQPALLVRSIPDRPTVMAGVWVMRGSAHDPEAMAGATHVVEHLTLRRCGDHDRASLARLVDRLGGEVDAWTATDLMGVSVHTTSDALGEALDLLSDAILEPTFDPVDVALEKRVIAAELELIRDDPAEQVEEALLQAAWGNHPLARPVIGTEETLSRLEPEALRAHHASLVQPGRMLAAVAGDVNAAEVARRLSRLPLEQPPSPPPLPPLRWAPRHHNVVRHGIDQVHARLAFPGLSSSDPRVPALSVLNRVLGVGASSRLFQRLREDEGLTYDIWSGLLLRASGGLLEVGWVCAPEVLADVSRLVLEELSAFASGFTADEVEVAREGLIRGLRMDAETPAGQCAMDVGEFLNKGRRFDLERVLGEILAIRTDDVLELARNLLQPAAMASAVCGPEGAALQVA